MKQSFLTNDRIYLRAVEPEDMDIMYEMENDPSMWDISNFTVPYSRYVLRQYPLSWRGRHCRSQGLSPARLRIGRIAVAV